jgi:hypothetical protein
MYYVIGGIGIIILIFCIIRICKFVVAQIQFNSKVSKIININKNKAEELKSKIQGRGPDAKPDLAETQDNLILTSAIRDFHKSKGNK